MAKCSVGAFLAEECSAQPTHGFRIHGIDEKYILTLRTGYDAIHNICELHFDRFFRRYSLHQECCCDPFKRHNNKILRGIRSVWIRWNLTQLWISFRVTKRAPTIGRLFPNTTLILSSRLMSKLQQKHAHQATRMEVVAVSIGHISLSHQIQIHQLLRW